MSKKPPPLLGYNTNVRHHGNLFHIQTEDSGVDHPHIITHLFVEGTILATKKSSYVEVLEKKGWEGTVRTMMKDQHRAMFIELRDGVHDDTAARIFGTMAPSRESVEEVGEIDASETDDDAIFDDTSLEEEKMVVDLTDPDTRERVSHPPKGLKDDGGVRVIRPADMSGEKAAKSGEKTAGEKAAGEKAAGEKAAKSGKIAASADVPKSGASLRYRSVFDTPDDDGEFGENLITDKSLDEVILSYLTDELEE